MNKEFNKKVKHFYATLNRIGKFGSVVNISSNGLCFPDEYEKAFDYGRHWAVIEKDDILLSKIPNDRVLKIIPNYVKDVIGKATDTKYVEDVYIDGDKLMLIKCKEDEEPETIEIGYFFIPIESLIEDFKTYKDIISNIQESKVNIENSIELAIDDIASYDIDGFTSFQYSKFLVPSLNAKESSLSIYYCELDNIVRRVFRLDGGDDSLGCVTLVHGRHDIISYHSYIIIKNTADDND